MQKKKKQILRYAQDDNENGMTVLAIAMAPIHCTPNGTNG
jgi:hypothetical protein